MAVYKSKYGGDKPKSQENIKINLELIEKLNAHLAEAHSDGSDRAIDRAHSAGKMTARERIEKLLDPGAEFFELCTLAGLGNSYKPGGTVIVGIGKVSGRTVMITANVPTVKGGAIDHATLQKSLRCNRIALENKLPVINLVESAGADLTDQARIFNQGGENFRDITRRSKAGIPTVSIVFGNSTAGGAYIPGMSDYTIMVKKAAKVFLAGPPLVKMATGEETDDESLGGAEMHSRISGVSDLLAKDEDEAIDLARELMGYLGDEGPATEKVEEPNFDSEEILGVLPADLKNAFDQRELIARFVDGSEFLDFKPLYGPTLVTCFARVGGHKVGIIANNGVLVSEAANKGAHFIQLCNQNKTPIIFLQNITGFMVGKKFEMEGIIKDGAKMINAVSNSNVPAITIVTGASYGAGNYAMCGRAFEPRFLFAYPGSKIAVMGSKQIAGVMQIIAKSKAASAGFDYDEEQGKAMADHLAGEAEKQSTSWYSTSQVWDDGVIDPRDTRKVLIQCLEVANRNPQNGEDGFGVFRM